MKKIDSTEVLDICLICSQYYLMICLANLMGDFMC